jgi:hypothetical protein
MMALDTFGALAPDLPPWTHSYASLDPIRRLGSGFAARCEARLCLAGECKKYRLGYAPPEPERQMDRAGLEGTIRRI